MKVFVLWSSLCACATGVPSAVCHAKATRGSPEARHTRDAVPPGSAAALWNRADSDITGASEAGGGNRIE